MRRRGDSIICAEEGGDTGADSERHATGTVNRQQAMNALEMEEWRKVRRKKKYEMDRPNDKLVVGARMAYIRKMEGSEVEKYNVDCRTRILAGRRDALHGKVLTHPSDSVNPDTFGDGGSGQGWRAAPL